MDDILILDVGGIKFKTTKSTLKKYPDTYFTGKSFNWKNIIIHMYPVTALRKHENLEYPIGSRKLIKCNFRLAQ